MKRARFQVLAAALLGAVAAACTGESNATTVAESRPARQIIVAVDLSASRSPQMLADARAFLEAVVEELSYGDQIVLLEVNQSGPQEQVRRWSGEVPARVDPTFESSQDQNRLAGARSAARAVAEEFFESGAEAGHTDLISTLHLAGDYLRDARGRRPTIVLLSDMLQSANGIEMERLQRMPDAQWIEERKAGGLLPPIEGACVAVVGADPSTPEGSKVRSFWVDYFEAAGASLAPVDYRIVNPTGALPRCAA